MWAQKPLSSPLSSSIRFQQYLIYFYLLISSSFSPSISIFSCLICCCDYFWGPSSRACNILFLASSSVTVSEYSLLPGRSCRADAVRISFKFSTLTQFYFMQPNSMLIGYNRLHPYPIIMRPNSSSSRQWETFTGPPQSMNSSQTIASQQSQKPTRKKGASKYFYSAVLCVLYLKKIKKSIKKRKHRDKILQEWYNTECSYNMDLNTSNNLIRKPMEQAGLINSDQSQILFPEIEGMIQLSNMMIKVIEDCRKMRNPNKIMLGKEINKFANGYKLYGGYFGAHSKSSSLLAELAQKNEEKIKSIEVNMQAQLAAKQSKKESMTIKDCMEQPLYRLFKYVLLLKQYNKKLPVYHPDHDSIGISYNTFHEINNFNNDLMKRIEDQEKKVKLDRLFGEALKSNRFLISEMQASTIYFDAKLYIFNDLVIISKVEELLGSEREEKYGAFELNQFGYVSEQDNMKYFKNILILITKENCIHLFFPDEGSRLEFFKCMQKIFREIRIKQYERRRVGDGNKVPKKKPMFTLHEQQASTFLLEPEFRVQIVGIEVRPLSTLTNDTVYIARFMIPEYYQDELNFLQGEGIADKTANRDSHNISKQNATIIQRYNSIPFNVDESVDEGHAKQSRQNTFRCINQKIQVHFSVLQQIYKQMKNICPDRLPEIDPITKDVNIYAKGKRKTKAFEVRKFFIEEFFNFIFRHENIMSNPIWFISRLRINQDLWNYSTERNTQLKRDPKQNQKSFGYEHCGICKKGKISSVQQFEHYRGYYLSSPDHRTNKDNDRYCFNFLNLIRVRLLSFNYMGFNTMERILLFYHYLQGRLDYPFTMHRCNDKAVKALKIYSPSLDDNFVVVNIDSKSSVGEVLDELGNVYKMKSSFDYDLVANYSGKNRILDRDEFLIDVVKSLNINAEESNKSNEKTGFFDTIKNWKKELFNNTDGQNKIYFIKTTCLHRSLELKSFWAFPEKKRLETQRIFWSIKKGLIKLTEFEFIQMAALFYCLRQLDGIQHFSVLKMSNKTLERVTPGEYYNLINGNEKFRTNISNAIETEKSYLLKCNKDTSYIHNKIIEFISQKQDYYTYFLEVEPREIPESILPKNNVQGSCLIGVNYRSFIVTKNSYDTTPLVSLPISELEYSMSVFSIFVTFEALSFRFDGKMMYHFGQMLKKYQVIAKKFPQ